MSLNSILSIARTALLTHQTAMEVSGNNIANAETPGYTRQELQLSASPPLSTAYGNYGTGVSIVNVSSNRDALLDQNLRTQSAPASGYGTRSDLLGRIESVFGEPSDTGLANTLDAFWNSWSDLASHPDNAGSQTVVQQRALALTDQLNSYANQLSAIGADTRSGIADTVSQANKLTSQIASLNTQIVTAEAGGHTAGDVRDERDRLIDELSTIVPVQVINRTNGSDQIMIGGMPLVDGPVSHDLTYSEGPPGTIKLAGDSDPLLTMGGKLGAMLDVLNVDLRSAQTALDGIASSLVTDVNAIHATGWSAPSGAAGNWNPATPPTGSGVNFFDPDPANATARNIRLSDAVAANAAAIAPGDALNETGNNNIALAMAALGNYSPSAPGNSYGDTYRNLITKVASASQSATDSASVSQTLVSNAESRRSSVNGVSTDEELLRLMRHQQAYAAAAKLVQVVDQMSQTLLTLKT